MIAELVILFVALVFFLNLYVSWNDDYWLKQDIPFIEPVKVFGNIKEAILMRKTIGEVYTEIYRKLAGKPLGGFFKLRTPILMVREPRLIGRVLVEDFDNFHDNDIQIMRDVDPIFKMNPFVTRGTTWKSLRGVLSPCDSSTKLKRMMPLLTPICDNMVQYIKNQTVLPVEVKDLSGKYMTDAVGSLVFGEECNSFGERGPPEFRRMTGKLFDAGLTSNIALLCAFYAPFLGNIFKFRIIPKKVADYFIEAVKGKCRERVRENKGREDFLQELVDVNKESEASGEGTVYSYSQIAAHCITFLTGGYYTSASTLCFCLYELARNPGCQGKLREEILRVGDSLQSFQYDRLETLPYLRKFISETMRLHPPIQTMTRVCTRDTEIEDDGHVYRVKAGTPVTVPIRALHRDPLYFPDPETFDPDRFDWEPSALRPPHVYLPFGEGPRTCLGVSLALMQVKVALVSLLLNFELELRDGMNELTLDPHKFLTTAKGDLRISFNKINKS